jgi:hypothetical protein
MVAIYSWVTVFSLLIFFMHFLTPTLHGRKYVYFLMVTFLFLHFSIQVARSMGQHAETGHGDPGCIFGCYKVQTKFVKIVKDIID